MCRIFGTVKGSEPYREGTRLTNSQNAYLVYTIAFILKLMYGLLAAITVPVGVIRRQHGTKLA